MVIYVIRAVLDGITIPTLGFNNANVLELMLGADPIKISVIVNEIFLFKLLYFFLNYSLSISRAYRRFS